MDRRTTAPPRRWGVLVTLGALTTFGALSTDLYLPTLPELGHDLSATDALAQLTISACMVGLALGQLVAGPLSDRAGRRRPLLAGLVVFAVASLLCGLAPNLWLLVALRLVQGLAGAAGLVISRAMVRDLYSGERAVRVFSSLMAVTGLAPVVAPLVGGQLARVTDWRGTFLVLAGVGVVLLGAALFLPETHPPQARHRGTGVAAQFAALGRDRGFAGYVLVLALGGSALFTYIGLSSFVLQDGYGLDAQAYSLIFAANSVGIVIASNVNRLVIRRFGPRRMLATGLCTGLTGGVVALTAALTGAGLPMLLPGLFLVVSGIGLVMPNATALGMDRHGDRAGSASALLGTLQFLSGAVVPPALSSGGATDVVMAAGSTGSYLAAIVAFVALTRAPGAASARMGGTRERRGRFR